MAVFSIRFKPEKFEYHYFDYMALSTVKRRRNMNVDNNALLMASIAMVEKSSKTLKNKIQSKIHCRIQKLKK